MRKNKSITLRHIADELGLSVMTVSKAMRGLPGMSEETRRRIIEYAYDAGYRTKEQERIHAIEHIPIYHRKPFHFKFIISENIRFAELNQMILTGLQSKLSEYDHQLETIILPYTCKQQNDLQEWAETHQLEYSDGLFIPRLINEEHESFLLQLKKPRILINFPKPGVGVDSVVWDTQAAMLQSVQYLISKGHRRILYVGSITKDRAYMIRWRTFNEAMSSHGIPCNIDDHVIEDDEQDQDRTTIIAQKIKKFQPTAILVAQSHDLVWIYYACSMLGKRIPQDYSLVGPELTDNPFISQLSRPILMVRESGIRAAERMLWRIANPHLPYEHIYLQGDFYEGATVKQIDQVII